MEREGTLLLEGSGFYTSTTHSWGNTVYAGGEGIGAVVLLVYAVATHAIRTSIEDGGVDWIKLRHVNKVPSPKRESSYSSFAPVLLSRLLAEFFKGVAVTKCTYPVLEYVSSRIRTHWVGDLLAEHLGSRILASNLAHRSK